MDIFQIRLPGRAHSPYSSAVRQGYSTNACQHQIAHRLLAEIGLKIRMGSFVMREYFPEGGTVAHQLDH
ncbi:MAG: DUF3596 domain-containing protein [Comamonas sp.]|jgi:hypothetical protein|nr:DUF3596 domain-containing protein [Comamonas sp.]